MDKFIEIVVGMLIAGLSSGGIVSIVMTKVMAGQLEELKGLSHILCKRSFSVIINHSIFKENSKVIHGCFPVLNRHCPFLTGIFQGQI